MKLLELPEGFALAIETEDTQGTYHRAWDASSEFRQIMIWHHHHIQKFPGYEAN